MAIWHAKFVNFEGTTSYTANLTVEDLGNGTAKGTLRNLSGPVKVTEIDLAGVVRGNEFTLGGSVQELGVTLALTFSPFVFGFTGGARIAVHGSNQALDLFVITQATE